MAAQSTRERRSGAQSPRRGAKRRGAKEQKRERPAGQVEGCRTVLPFVSHAAKGLAARLTNGSTVEPRGGSSCWFGDYFRRDRSNSATWIASPEGASDLRSGRAMNR